MENKLLVGSFRCINYLTVSWPERIFLSREYYNNKLSPEIPRREVLAIWDDGDDGDLGSVGDVRRTRLTQLQHNLRVLFLKQWPVSRLDISWKLANRRESN
jgi:hypothetical protein